MILPPCEPLSDNDLNKRKIIRFGDDVRKHLPSDAIGGSMMKDFAANPLTFKWRTGSSQVDMPLDQHGRRLRWFFRPREKGFVRKFFDEAHAAIGDVVLLEEIGSHEFWLHIEKPDGSRISGADPTSVEKERIRKWALRETRPDQQEFRRTVAERDGLKCAVSGCDIPEVLDAAHLAPRSPGGSDDPSNGMILRADLHRLFDAGLLKLDESGVAGIASDVRDPDYRRYHGESARTAANLKNLAARSDAS